MSATDSTNSEHDACFVATIAERDLHIEELRKEINRPQLLLNSVRFGAKSERQRPAEDAKQPSLSGEVELPAAIPQAVEREIEVPAHARRARKRYTDKDGNPNHFPERPLNLKYLTER